MGRQVASAMVRSYTGQTLTALAGDLAVLEGTYGRRLLLRQRPVTAVAVVTIDGRTVEDYRWTRRGWLCRLDGWGGPDAAVVVEYDHGYALAPDDLRAVTETAAARLMVNPEQLASLREGGDGRYLQYGPAGGFTLGERLVLDRYRRRTL